MKLLSWKRKVTLFCRFHQISVGYIIIAVVDEKTKTDQFRSLLSIEVNLDKYFLNKYDGSNKIRSV
jgi:hypothetical protein